MEWSKAKSMLILILLAANIFLGVSIYTQVVEIKHAERQMVIDSCSILNVRGIEIEEDTIFDLAATWTGYIIRRDFGAEKRLASAILGQNNDEDYLGGGIYTYVAGDAYITFRSGGHIEVSTAGETNLASHLNSAIAIPQMSIETEDGGYQLMLSDTPILNAVLNDDNGIISGNWIVGGEVATEQSTISRSALVLALGDIIGSGTDEVVQQIDCVYIMSTTQNGELSVIPAWEVTLSGGVIYVNCLNGEQIIY